MRWGLIAGGGGYRPIYTVFNSVSSSHIHYPSRFPLMLLNDPLNSCGHSWAIRA